MAHLQRSASESYSCTSRPKSERSSRLYAFKLMRNEKETVRKLLPYFIEKSQTETNYVPFRSRKLSAGRLDSVKRRSDVCDVLMYRDATPGLDPHRSTASVDDDSSQKIRLCGIPLGRHPITTGSKMLHRCANLQYTSPPTSPLLSMIGSPSTSPHRRAGDRDCSAPPGTLPVPSAVRSESPDHATVRQASQNSTDLTNCEQRQHHRGTVTTRNVERRKKVASRVGDSEPRIDVESSSAFSQHESMPSSDVCEIKSQPPLYQVTTDLKNSADEPGVVVGSKSASDQITQSRLGYETSTTAMVVPLPCVPSLPLPALETLKPSSFVVESGTSLPPSPKAATSTKPREIIGCEPHKESTLKLQSLKAENSNHPDSILTGNPSQLTNLQGTRLSTRQESQQTDVTRSSSALRVGKVAASFTPRPPKKAVKVSSVRPPLMKHQEQSHSIPNRSGLYGEGSHCTPILACTERSFEIPNCITALLVPVSMALSSNSHNSEVNSNGKASSDVTRECAEEKCETSHSTCVHDNSPFVPFDAIGKSVYSELESPDKLIKAESSAKSENTTLPFSSAPVRTQRIITSSITPALLREEETTVQSFSLEVTGPSPSITATLCSEKTVSSSTPHFFSAIADAPLEANVLPSSSLHAASVSEITLHKASDLPLHSTTTHLEMSITRPTTSEVSSLAEIPAVASKVFVPPARRHQSASPSPNQPCTGSVSPNSTASLPVKPSSHFEYFSFTDKIKSDTEIHFPSSAIPILEPETFFHTSEFPYHVSEIPFTVTQITFPGSEIPCSSSEIPFPASEIPCSSSEIPRSGSEIPSSASEIPFFTSEITFPASSIHLPASAIPLPASAIPLPASAIPLSASTICLPASTIPLPPSAIPLPPSAIPLPPSAIPLPPSAIPLPPSAIPLPPSAIPLSSSEISLYASKISPSASDILLPSHDILLPSPDISLPSPDISLPSPDISLPSPDISLPSPDISLPSTDISLPPSDISLPSSDISLPLPDISLPSPDIRLPSRNISLPSGNISLSSGNISLPSRNISLPSSDISLPPSDISLPSPDISLPLPEVSLLLPDVSLPLPDIPLLSTLLPSLATTQPSLILGGTSLIKMTSSLSETEASLPVNKTFANLEAQFSSVEMMLPSITELSALHVTTDVRIPASNALTLAAEIKPVTKVQARAPDDPKCAIEVPMPSEEVPKRATEVYKRATTVSKHATEVNKRSTKVPERSEEIIHQATHLSLRSTELASQAADVATHAAESAKRARKDPVQMTEVISQAIEVSPCLTEAFLLMAEDQSKPGFIQVAKVPIPMKAVPISAEKVPKSVKEVSPKSVKEVSPKSVKEMSPKSVKEVSPKSVKEVPKSVNEVHKSVKQVPKSVKQVPKSVKEVPKSVMEVPKSMKKVPKSVKEVHTFNGKVSVSEAQVPIPGSRVSLFENAVLTDAKEIPAFANCGAIDSFEVLSELEVPPPVTEGLSSVAEGSPSATEVPSSAIEVPPSASGGFLSATEKLLSTTELPPSATDVLPSATDVLPSATDVLPSATDVIPYATEVSISATEMPPSATGVPPSAIGVSPSAAKVPSSATEVLSSVTEEPLSATEVHSSATKVPSSATKVPSSATKMPSSATRMPSSAIKVPSSVTKVPSSVTKVPSSATKVPSSATKVPSPAIKVPSSETGVPPSVTEGSLRSVTESYLKSVSEGALPSVTDGFPPSITKESPPSVAEGPPPSVTEGSPPSFTEGFLPSITQVALLQTKVLQSETELSSATVNLIPSTEDFVLDQGSRIPETEISLAAKENTAIVTDAVQPVTNVAVSVTEISTDALEVSVQAVPVVMIPSPGISREAVAPTTLEMPDSTLRTSSSPTLSASQDNEHSRSKIETPASSNLDQMIHTLETTSPSMSVLLISHSSLPSSGVDNVDDENIKMYSENGTHVIPILLTALSSKEPLKISTVVIHREQNDPPQCLSNQPTTHEEGCIKNVCSDFRDERKVSDQFSRLSRSPIADPNRGKVLSDKASEIARLQGAGPAKPRPIAFPSDVIRSNCQVPWQHESFEKNTLKLGKSSFRSKSSSPMSTDRFKRDSKEKRFRSSPPLRILKSTSIPCKTAAFQVNEKCKTSFVNTVYVDVSPNYSHISEVSNSSLKSSNDNSGSSIPPAIYVSNFARVTYSDIPCFVGATEPDENVNNIAKTELMLSSVPTKQNYCKETPEILLWANYIADKMVLEILDFSAVSWMKLFYEKVSETVASPATKENNWEPEGNCTVPISKQSDSEVSHGSSSHYDESADQVSVIARCSGESASSADRQTGPDEASASTSGSSAGSEAWWSPGGPVQRRDVLPQELESSPPASTRTAPQPPRPADSDADKEGYASDDDFDAMDEDMRRLEEKIRQFEHELEEDLEMSLMDEDVRNKKMPNFALLDKANLRSSPLPLKYPTVTMTKTKHLSLMPKKEIDEYLDSESDSDSKSSGSSNLSDNVLFVKRKIKIKSGDRRCFSLDLKKRTFIDECKSEYLLKMLSISRTNGKSEAYHQPTEEEGDFCLATTCVAGGMQTDDFKMTGSYWKAEDGMAQVDSEDLVNFYANTIPSGVFFIFEDDSDEECTSALQYHEEVVRNQVQSTDENIPNPILSICVPQEMTEPIPSLTGSSGSPPSEQNKTSKFVSSFKSSFVKATKSIGPKLTRKRSKASNLDSKESILTKSHSSGIDPAALMADLISSGSCVGSEKVDRLKFSSECDSDDVIPGQYRAYPAVCVTTDEENNIPQYKLFSETPLVQTDIANNSGQLKNANLNAPEPPVRRSSLDAIVAHTPPGTLKRRADKRIDGHGQLISTGLPQIVPPPPCVPPRTSTLNFYPVRSHPISIGNKVIKNDDIVDASSAGKPIDCSSNQPDADGGHKATSVRQLKRRQQERKLDLEEEETTDVSGCSFCIRRSRTLQDSRHNRYQHRRCSPHPRALTLPQRRSWPPRK